MNRRWVLTIIVMVALAVIGGVAYWRSLTEKLETSDEREYLLEYPLRRLIRYSFTVENPEGRFLPKAEFRTYAPVKQTPTQRTVSINSSHPYRLVEDDLGNQELHFTIERLPPSGSTIVSVTAELELTDRPNKLLGERLDRFLIAERYIESDHPHVQQLATTLLAKDSIETARNAYRWVTTNLRESGYLKEDRGALYATEHKHGDCTEHAYLFTALSRANKLPARSVAGYVYRENAVLRPRDYHNWAEVYVNERWRIVDPQKENFMENPSHYIATRFIAVSNDPEENSQRFFDADPRLRVTLN